eukprot:TRINITY_DN8809_c0_g2_i1.p1 TRINITY_DN8809_c0_g2~~TRINITY_DN8809_c0_g2_i1.p1  ORF type:complete len:157 (+),score=19.12 TRINITY_DN8809_c0_g2_i1:222-692(+)
MATSEKSCSSKKNETAYQLFQQEMSFMLYQHEVTKKEEQLFHKMTSVLMDKVPSQDSTPQDLFFCVIIFLVRCWILRRPKTSIVRRISNLHNYANNTKVAFLKAPFMLFSVSRISKFLSKFGNSANDNKGALLKAPFMLVWVCCTYLFIQCYFSDI